MLNDAMSKLFLDYWNMPPSQKAFFVMVDAVLLMLGMWSIYYLMGLCTAPRTPHKSKEDKAQPSDAPASAETYDSIDEACLVSRRDGGAASETCPT
jgi:hypothetical protein